MDSPDTLRRRFNNALHPEQQYRGKHSSSKTMPMLIATIGIVVVGVIYYCRVHTESPYREKARVSDPLFQPF